MNALQLKSQFDGIGNRVRSLAARGHVARWCVIAWAMLLLIVPVTARSDIYKWTDEQGRTIISNILPENPDKAKNVERIVKENKPAAPAFKSAATPTEQMLLDKIENLERRLQPRNFPPAPASATAPADYYYEGGYYPPPPPPYYSNYAPVYYPRQTYVYPIAPAYSYVTYASYPRTFVTRPVYASAARGAAFRGGAAHHGRR